MEKDLQMSAPFVQHTEVKNHVSWREAIKESLALSRPSNCRCSEENYSRLSDEATDWWIDDEIIYFTFIDEKTLSGWTVYMHSTLDVPQQLT